MADRILCVDDDPNILEGYKRRLRKEFELDTAVGPEEGFRMVTEQGPFAVVVSDLQMPGENPVVSEHALASLLMKHSDRLLSSSSVAQRPIRCSADIDSQGT